MGSRASGISNYTLNLLEEFSRLNPGVPFIVYLNRKSEGRVQNIHFPENFTIRWAPRLISPDYHFKGHLLRLLYSNYLSLRYRKALIFNASQMEANFFRRNQVITVHDVIPLLFREYHRRQYYYFKYILPIALRFAKYVITPSTHTKKLLQRNYDLPPGKIHVVPHGVRESCQEYNEKSRPGRDNFILFTGRIGPMKNIAAVVRAFHLILRNIPHDLVIVGEGKEKLEGEIKAGRLSQSEIDHDRIIIKGYVPDDEMADYFSNASLLVFPSLYEGFGLPPLEAMSRGCPVIVSRTASLPEECGEAAYYVNPYSVESIAKGMHDILTDPRLRQDLVQKGFQRATIFRWESSAWKHMCIIQDASNSLREYQTLKSEESCPIRKRRFRLKIPPIT